MIIEIVFTYIETLRIYAAEEIQQRFITQEIIGTFVRQSQ